MSSSPDADAPRWRRLEPDERREQILDCAVGTAHFHGVPAAAAAAALYTGVLAPFVIPVVGFILSRGETRGLPTQRSHSRLPGVKTLNRRTSAGSTQVL